MRRRFARAATAALACVALAIPACHRGKPGAADYFPLDAGMAWTFRFRASTGASGELVTTNLAPRKILGVMAVGQRNTGGTKSFTEYYAADQDGIRYVARETPDGLEPHMDDHSYVVKYPIQVGTSWREVDRTLDGTVFFAKTMIESVSDKVTVPAGTFSGCVRVRETGTASPVKGVASFYRVARREIAVEDYYWMAPGVGVIKGTHRESVGEGVMARSIRIELELVRFKR
jgi:hypothetical protein